MISLEMAYINVAEWTPEHVAEWLQGLEDSILPYIPFFLNNEIDGHLLLNLIPDDLNRLHIFKIGHQELILEAVDLLKQLHYGLTSESLQSLALKLGCKARSLYNDLKLNGPQENLENVKQERVSTDTLSAVSDILVSVKYLISWLDRYPFEYQDQYVRVRKSILKHSIELASTAQRDQFAEKPHSVIKNSSLSIAEICDKVVQDFNDSLIIQPAALDIATIKKKPDEELGMHIQSTYSGVHIVGGIKPQSPARRCSKVEEGDEIIQINYQTVIGWQLKKLVYAMREQPTEIHLTLKKRPRHTNILGQVIILRPYRIPSKKTAFGKVHKWSEGNSSLHIQEVYSTSNDRANPRDDDDDDDDSAFLPDDAVSTQLSLSKDNAFQYRIFSTTSHATVQRRATVSGASPTVLKPPVNIEDLVHGVPSIKKRENVGRSISHDPATSTSSEEKSENYSIQKLDTIKSDESEENLEKTLASCESNGSDAVIRQKVAEHDSNMRPYTTIGITRNDGSCGVNDPMKRERSPIPIASVLPVQEEAYTILENKSLEKLKEKTSAEKNHLLSPEKADDGDKEIVPNKSEDISSHCDENENPVSRSRNSSSPTTPTEKKNFILFPWEGADTVFCGRRPSAHDISNEIAGSKLTENPSVCLRRASKLPVSPSSEDLENLQKISKSTESSSYQVVVIGGVPQKCDPVVKDGRRSSECMLSHLSHSKKKTKISEKFGNRRISCKDLGMGDCQGWLYKQKEGKSFLSSGVQWTKRWIVLKKHYLYAYKDKNGTKAECLIFLPGSTVSPAVECKSKKYSFKVCKQNVTIYFATESQEDLSKWMNKMGLAAIAYDASADFITSGFLKPDVVLGVENNFYSETEESDDNSPAVSRRVLDSHLRKYSAESSSLSSDHSSSGSSLSTPGKVDLASIQYNKKAVPQEVVRNVTAPDARMADFKRQCPKPQISFASSNLQKKSYGPPKPREYEKSTHDKPEKVESYKTSYNRSFSCSESSCAPPVPGVVRNAPRKMSCEDSAVSQSLPYRYNENQYYQNNSSSWSAADEEYDILTNSLGRQKSLVKEITPGLVARMAVSYSNLNQQNISVNNIPGRLNQYKGAASPGYVAKISDSFNHLAKESNSSESGTAPEMSPSAKASLVSQSRVIGPQSNYKRSASESHVPLPVGGSSGPRTVSLSSYSQLSSESDSSRSCAIPGKQLTMLDREFLRLYGKKKVSDVALKTSSKSSMKYFPSEKAVEEDKRNCKPTSGVSGRHSVAKDKNRSDVNSRHFSKSSLNVKFPVENSTKSQPCGSDQSTGVNDHMGSDRSISSSVSQTKVGSSHIVQGIENLGFCFPEKAKGDVKEVEKARPNPELRFSYVSDADSSKRNSYCSADSYGTSISKQEKEEAMLSPVKSNSTFSFFGSPKFMKKISSPKLDKKNIFKSKKLAKELKKAEQKELSAASHCERKFLGSPRLGRAIFGSPKLKKGTDSPPASLSDVQTTSATSSCAKPMDFLKPGNLARSDSSFNTSSVENQSLSELRRSSSNSSFNSDTSSSMMSTSAASAHQMVELRAKPSNMFIPVSSDSFAENRLTSPETPRTPLKPTMGIAMLGKRRLPSFSGDGQLSAATAKSSQETVSTDPLCATPEGCADAGKASDDEMSHLLGLLRQADLSLDGVDLRARRCRTILMHFDNKRVSQLVLSLRALQRTLKDKETELETIDELLSVPSVNHEEILLWVSKHSDVIATLDLS